MYDIIILIIEKNVSMQSVRPRLLKSLVDSQRDIRVFCFVLFFFFASSKLEELKVQNTSYSSGSPTLPCISIT